MTIFTSLMTFCGVVILLISASVIVGYGLIVGVSWSCGSFDIKPLVAVNNNYITMRDFDKAAIIAELQRMTAEKIHMQNDDMEYAIKTAELAIHLVEENKKLEAKLNERKKKNGKRI